MVGVLQSDLPRTGVDTQSTKRQPSITLLPDRNFHVAIVDADAERRDGLRQLLTTDKRFEVHDAQTLDEFLALGNGRNLDCVLIGPRVGELTAFAVNEKLTMTWPNPPAAIMIADEISARTAIQAFRSGFMDYLKRSTLDAAGLRAAVTRVANIRRERLREKRQLEQLSEMAMRDALTGLSNRNALEEHLTKMMEAGLRHGKPFAIILMDINRFKHINDTFGHFIGDHALKAFAERLKQTARHSDVYGRLGGDEFLYLIGDGVSLEAIRSACERLSRALSFDIDLDNLSFSISASIGAAIYPIDGKSVEEMLKAADGAMYAAKRADSLTCLAFERQALQLAPDTPLPDRPVGTAMAPPLPNTGRAAPRKSASRENSAKTPAKEEPDPAASREAAMAAPRQVPAVVNPRTAPRAFVIDDDPQICGVVSRALERRGYACSEYTTLRQVEAALGVIKPDLIVLDLPLGESDAVEVMKRIGTSPFDGHILLISGHDLKTMEQVQRLGEREGLKMLPVLRKPFRIREFGARLDELGTATPVGDADELLGQALENGWLEVWYQPKIDLATMSVCGSEALARIRHPERGLLYPRDFLPAPNSRLYRRFGEFILETALKDWTAIAAPSATEGRSAHHIAVNVPAALLLSPGFVERIRAMLPDDPRFPGMIVELTENETISDPAAVSEIAIQLRLNKVSMSIDDFGSGQSTIARLAQLPFTEIKLDRSFIDGCANDETKKTMCRYVVGLAHGAGMMALAEGVETTQDLQTVIEMGFDFAQGFVFEQAMTRDDLARLLETPNIGFGNE